MVKTFYDLVQAWSNIPQNQEYNFLEDLSLSLNKNRSFLNCNIAEKITLNFVKNKNYNEAIHNLNIYMNKYGFKKSNCKKDLMPQFDINNITIVFNCDNNFVKYLAVTIQSIVDNSSEQNNYDIIILNNDITLNNQNLLLYIVSKFKNFSIRFFNMDYFINKYNVHSWFCINHIQPVAYYRLFVSKIFKNFDKIIYLDADLVLQEDIANLYKNDISEAAVLAVKDFTITACANIGGEPPFFSGLNDYLRTVLKIYDIKTYFNSGVLVLNIQKIIKKNYFNQFIRTARINNRFMHDQNVLNSILQYDKILLNNTWNYQVQDPNGEKYAACDWQRAKIIHYASKFKPWKNLENLTEVDYIWWKYAKETPFYEQILKTNFEVMLSAREKEEIKLLKIINSKNDIRYNYYRTKLLSKVTFGKVREHYKEKRNRLKSDIRRLRDLAR